MFGGGCKNVVQIYIKKVFFKIIYILIWGEGVSYPNWGVFTPLGWCVKISLIGISTTHLFIYSWSPSSTYLFTPESGSPPLTYVFTNNLINKTEHMQKQTRKFKCINIVYKWHIRRNRPASCPASAEGPQNFRHLPASATCQPWRR